MKSRFWLGGPLLLAALSAIALTMTGEPSAQAERTLVSIEHDELRLLDGKGGSRLRHRFGAGRATQGVSILHWQQQGEYQAVVAFLHVPKGQKQSYEYLLLRHSEVVFQQIRPGSFNPTTYLGSDGSLTVEGETNWLRDATGRVVELRTYTPMGPMLASDLLPVVEGSSTRPGLTLGLLRISGPPESWQLQKLPASPNSHAYTRTSSQQLLFVEPDGSRLWVIREKEQFPIALPPGAGWFLLGAGGDRYWLLGEPAVGGDRLLLADLKERQVRPLNLSHKLVRASGLESLTIDEQGHLFFSSVDGDRLQLLRSDDLGRSVRPVGAPMIPGPSLGGERWLLPKAAAGQALILNLSAGYGNMLNSVQFTGSPAPTILPGGGYFLHPGPAAESALTRDGRCAAIWLQSSRATASEERRFQLHFFSGTSWRPIATQANPTLLRFAE